MKKKEKSFISQFILTSIQLIYMTGCKVDLSLTVTTEPVKDITSTSATCIGSIHSGSV